MSASLRVIFVVCVMGCSDQQTPEKEYVTQSAEVYNNPVDHKSYIAPDSWKTYYPKVPRADVPDKTVKIVEVRLLTSETALELRTNVTVMTAYAKEAENLAETTFAKCGKRFQILVQFTCKPDSHEVKLAHDGEANLDLLQMYYDALMSAKLLPVSDGEVSFQMILLVEP